MKITVTVVFRNKEKDKEETSELTLFKEDISCLYKDSYGVYVVMKSGKSYKVLDTMAELKGELCLN